jgi:GDP-D-mannose 3',5'-epimerase
VAPAASLARIWYSASVDIKLPEFSPSGANEFKVLDLREPQQCDAAVDVSGDPAQEVYQLAADMGGMGFIHSAECDIVRNNALINIHMTHASANAGVSRYLFSSSACIYRDMAIGELEIDESGAYPAMPDNEYGWEKLYAERVAQTFGRHSKMAVRIARFQNCYGPEGTWQGGREKAPAAICRKVAMAANNGEIEVWGDGTAVRSFTYVDDMVDGIWRLMKSDLEGGVNIGCPEYVTVNELVRQVADVAGKSIGIRHVDGPVGVHSRNFSNARIESIGWRSEWSLRRGLENTYPWIVSQLRQTTAKMA